MSAHFLVWCTSLFLWEYDIKNLDYSINNWWRYHVHEASILFPNQMSHALHCANSCNKMHKIHEWWQPQNYNKVQCFLRLVQYLAHFMPDVTAYITPLSQHMWNGRPFTWTPLLDKCFESIKALTCQAPVLKPIDTSESDPIWVICDGSKSGVRAVYGQGPEWQTCHPAGFLSKKFSTAQQNYCTHEHETIAILEVLIHWQDKLLGWKFIIVTNHKSLKYFKTQPNLSSCQVKWWEYISQFNFTIQHVDGKTNRIANCLSHYYKTDGPEDVHPAHEFVSADAWLDPDGQLLACYPFSITLSCIPQHLDVLAI